jgi:DNA mismatch endonuclease (patch repair protein)
MTDVFSVAKRRAIMQRVRAKNSKPELAVRSLAHRMGYRFRLHRRDVPGCPDLVFPGRRKVILVHGCFWHRHHCRRGRSMPSTRVAFWRAKLDGNKRRDIKNRRALRRAHWGVLTLWECQTKNLEATAQRIVAFLNGD